MFSIFGMIAPVRNILNMAYGFTLPDFRKNTSSHPAIYPPARAQWEHRMRLSNHIWSWDQTRICLLSNLVGF